MFNVWPDARKSPGNAVVTVQDVLLAIYFHLRTAVKSDEYEAMSKSRKVEIFRAFESRVGTDPVQRGKGLRRVDFLAGRFRAQGLVRAQSKDNIWDVVILLIGAVWPKRRRRVPITHIIIRRTEKEEMYYWYLLTTPGAISPGQVLYNTSHQSIPPSSILISTASISSRHVIITPTLLFCTKTLVTRTFGE